MMISDNLTPAEFSDQQAASFISRSSVKGRKERGQFFTPLPVARFMAGLAEYRKEVLRVLDPGAGTGILSCAVCEAAARRKAVKRLEIDAYEIDPELAVLTLESLASAREWLKRQDIELAYKIIQEDFILSFQQGYGDGKFRMANKQEPVWSVNRFLAYSICPLSQTP